MDAHRHQACLADAASASRLGRARPAVSQPPGCSARTTGAWVSDVSSVGTPLSRILPSVDAGLPSISGRPVQEQAGLGLLGRVRQGCPSDLRGSMVSGLFHSFRSPWPGGPWAAPALSHTALGTPSYGVQGHGCPGGLCSAATLSSERVKGSGGGSVLYVKNQLNCPRHGQPHSRCSVMRAWQAAVRMRAWGGHASSGVWFVTVPSHSVGHIVVASTVSLAVRELCPSFPGSLGRLFCSRGDTCLIKAGGGLPFPQSLEHRS